MKSGALHCAGKELRVRLRDRWALLMWLLVPLTIGGMITALSDGGQPQPTAQLLVVDEDDSLISGFLISALGQTGDAELIQAESVSRQEGQERIEAGDASALLIVPEGFGDAVLNEQPSVLQLITNPAQQILPSIVEEFLSVLTDAVFYLHRVFGNELKIITAQIDALAPGESEVFADPMIAQLGVAINNAAETLVEYLDPMALELAAAEDEAEEASGLTFALVFFPGIIFIGMLFAAQGLSDSFWKERESGTLRRTLVSPLSLTEIFLGKLLSGAGLLFLLSAAMTTIGFVYHGLSPASWLPAVLWLTLSGLVLYGLMSLVQLIAPTRKSASLITSILIFPLMMIGGAFFPFEALPDWLKTIGIWVPNGYLLERLKAYLFYDGGINALATSLPYALAMAGLLWMLCAWRLKAFAGRAE
ncbi:MAG: ABC transporter permease [Gammaproteobacteria bacterium]|nr:ABC transporter permease [Gammaproteobacteria bacterium]